MLSKVALRALLLTLLIAVNTGAALARRGLQLHVIDEKGASIGYTAFVIQQVKDSAVIYTGLTDSAGDFSGPVLPAAACLLRVEAIGFTMQTTVIADSVASVFSQNITLRTDSRMLHNVTVTSRRPLLERRADRTIFNVENSVSAVGSDALEVLRRAPGIRVTESGLSIAGKSSLSVLIDDKLVQLSGDELVELLKSIPADNLARIEIITTPPAKYDAQGNSGLINLVMKKQLRNGLNGQVTAAFNQHTYSAVNSNGNFNFRQNKLNIYGIGTANKGRSFQEGEVISSYPAQEQAQHTGSVETYVYNRLQLGADYNLTPCMIIGARYTIGNGGPHYSVDEAVQATAVSLPARITDSLVQTAGSLRDRGVRNVFNLNWEWKPDTGGKRISADLDYFTRTGRAAQDFITQDFRPDGAPTGYGSDNRNSGVQVIDIRTAKLDAEWPLRFAKLSFGGKATFIHNTSDNFFQYRAGAEYQTDPSRTNAFDYHENTQALYISAAQTYGKWELQAGLRGEYTQTRGYSPTTGQTNTNDYFQLFPTAYAQYHHSDDHTFGIAYSRRIERPDFWHLNPFRFYTTPTSWEAGNPYLQPSFAHNIELSYVFKSSYTLTAFAERVRQYYARFSTIDTAARAVIFSEANLGSTAGYGLSLSANMTPVKWWECNAQLRGFTAAFTSGFYNTGAPVAYSKAAFALDADNTFTLNRAKTLLAELNGEYTSAQLSDFDVQQANWSVNAGLKLLMQHGRLIAGVNVQDIFRTDFTGYRNLSNGTYQRYYEDERNLHLSLSWKFGNSGIKARRERAADSEESKRL